MQYPSKREIRLMLCMTVCFDRQAHRPQPPDGTDPQGAVRAAQPCERVSAVRPRTVFLEHFLVSPSCDVRCGNASVVFLCFSGDAGISPATTSAAPSRQPARSRTSPSAGSRHRARLSLFPIVFLFPWRFTMLRGALGQRGVVLKRLALLPANGARLSLQLLQQPEAEAGSGRVRRPLLVDCEIGCCHHRRRRHE